MDPTVPLKQVEVLNNIETYLQEEEIRMITEDQQWSKTLKKEFVKICNISNVIKRIKNKQFFTTFVYNWSIIFLRQSRSIYNFKKEQRAGILTVIWRKMDRVLELSHYSYTLLRG